MGALVAGLALGSMSLVAMAPTMSSAAAEKAPTPRHQQTQVVHPGESIQAAVDRAHRGDTVIVTAGTYHQNVVIQKNGLTLRARGDVTLKPPASATGLCDSDEDLVGICVVPRDLDPTFTYTIRSQDVTVAGFRVVGFGDGVLGFGTRNLHVSHVTAVGNEGYGLASFDGIGSRIVGNASTGSDVAGVYVGDSPHADALVMHNRVWNNQFGFFIRHTHHVTVRNNHTWQNCLGLLLLHDGQPEGSGDNRVVGNLVARNNHTCTDDEDGTTFSGAGIVLLGSRHNAILGNTVLGNNRLSDFSGGVVLFGEANGNTVAGNYLRNNKPADIRKDPTSVRNHFINNDCQTSQPGWICA
jgi:nitrous oxidase accessory protein NosD